MIYFPEMGKINPPLVTQFLISSSPIMRSCAAEDIPKAVLEALGGLCLWGEAWTRGSASFMKGQLCHSQMFVNPFSSQCLAIEV